MSFKAQCTLNTALTIVLSWIFSYNANNDLHNNGTVETKLLYEIWHSFYYCQLVVCVYETMPDLKQMAWLWRPPHLSQLKNRTT